MINMKIRWFLSLCCLVALTACSPTPSENTTNITENIKVSDNKSAVVGQIVSSNDKPMANTIIRLCQVYYDSEHKNPSFVLEGATSPGAITDENGIFVINDVTPNEYVILIGDVTEYYDIVKENPDNAKIFLLTPGQVLDIGIIKTNLSPKSD